MDNNQQTPSQPAGKPDLSAQVSPGNVIDPGVSNLGVNEAGTMGGTGSPFTGSDVSMTTPERLGGKIVTTEIGSA